LEAFRLIAAADDFCPKHAVEFHWYSAEEVGLWGSQAVASSYKKAGRKVIAMLQNDMTGYVDKVSRDSGNPHFGILNDYTDKGTTTFVKSLIEKYTSMKAVDTRCGYGCSDHASWTKAGYRSAAPFEGTFGEMNPLIHTERDTVANIDFDHVLEFSKLAVGFAVELSQA
jgi:leucyl aminopeptidase